MNASRSASGSAESSSRIVADGLGAADLAPDLVALLLAEGRQVAVEVGAVGQRDDRADVLALEVDGPALGDLARPERGDQGVRRRVAAAQPAQVDDIPGGSPGRRVGRGGRPGHRRQRAGRRARPGSWRSPRGTRRRRRWRWRSVGPASARRRRRGAWSCGSSGVARLDLVPAHQRDDGDRLGVGPPGRPARRPGSRPRRCCRRPPTTRAGTPSRRTASPRCCVVPGRPRWLARSRRPAGAPPAGAGRSRAPMRILAGRRTGRLRCEGGRGHARMLAPDRGFVAGATSAPGPDFRHRPKGRDSRADLADDTRRDRDVIVWWRLPRGARHRRPGRARLHDHRVRDRLRDPRPALPDRAVRGRAPVGGRPDLLPARVRGPGLAGAAIPGLPARRGADGRGRRRVDPAGPGAAAHEPGHHPRDRRRRRVHRQRPAAHGGPGPAAPAGAGHRLRPDAGRAGPVVAPRLPPVEPRLLPAGAGPGRRPRSALGLARSSRRRHRRADRPVLDPVRAAVPVAPTAARRGDLDRRRLRRRPAGGPVHLASHADGRHDHHRRDRGLRHAAPRRAAARLPGRPGC